MYTVHSADNSMYTVSLLSHSVIFTTITLGFISYDSLSNVLKRFLDPADHVLVGDIVAQFDLNNDGKIDYLEFESFLNQKFPEVDKEASLYAGEEICSFCMIIGVVYTVYSLVIVYTAYTVF